MKSREKIFICLLVLLLLIGCQFPTADKTTQTTRKENTSQRQELPGKNQKAVSSDEQESTPENKSIDDQREEQVKTVNILATGDMIFHMPIVNASKTNGGYNFVPIFEQIQSQIEQADITVANFEGAIDVHRPLSKFPLFNFPKETVSSLKQVGFDVLSTANNHALDMKLSGLEQTHQLIASEQMLPVGTFVGGQRPPAVIEKNGIRIGFLAYTAPTNGMDVVLASEQKYQLNRLREDIVKDDIQSLKSHCDYVIVIPHWGVEYVHQPNEMQRNFADKMFLWGADAVLGSHPHVLQPAQTRTINGEKKFLIYSMGNSLSNQREELLKKKGVNTGVLVNLTLEKNNRNKTRLKDVQLQPTAVLRERKQGGGFLYRVVDIQRYLKENPQLTKTSPGLVKKLQLQYEEGMKVLNEQSEM